MALAASLIGCLPSRQPASTFPVPAQLPKPQKNYMQLRHIIIQYLQTSDSFICSWPTAENPRSFAATCTCAFQLWQYPMPTTVRSQTIPGYAQPMRVAKHFFANNNKTYIPTLICLTFSNLLPLLITLPAYRSSIAVVRQAPCCYAHSSPVECLDCYRRTLEKSLRIYLLCLSIPPH